MKTHLSALLPAAALAAFVCGCLSHSRSYNDSLIYYDKSGNSTKAYEGVEISRRIKIIDEGIFGKAFLIESPSVNLIPNGTFNDEKLECWQDVNSVFFMESGGVDNSACMMIKEKGSASIPLKNLDPENPLTLSFFFRSPDDGAISLEWECGEQKLKLLEREAAPKTFEKINVSMRPAAAAGMLKVSSAKGNVLLDNLQLAPSSNTAAYLPENVDLKSIESIDLPPTGHYFNPAEGSISCWLDLPWLSAREAGETPFVIFQIISTTKLKDDFAVDSENVIMSLECQPVKNRNNPEDKGVFLLRTNDATGRELLVSTPLEDINDKAKAWRHVVINWSYKDNIMSVDMQMDGGEVRLSKTAPLGPLIFASKVSVGFRGGVYLNGILDDFAIFSRPLTGKEISRIYQSREPLSTMIYNGPNY